MRIVVWGTGYVASEYMRRSSYYIGDDVIAFVDNNKKLWGAEFKTRVIIPPEVLNKLKFDRLVICTVYYAEIKEQISQQLKIDEDKVITYYELEDEIKDKLIEKYRESGDEDIRKVLEYYNTNSLNVYGYYESQEKDIYPVIYDHDGMPYILFEDKKMFFPKNYKFSRVGNAKCVANILFEQGEHSPHLYIKSDNMIKNDMVMVDAGVCEGNFALRYVERCKKIYLIESDCEWVKALERTFAPYKDKVIICNKYLSSEDTIETVTLDTLIDEKIDFLKMDIEGYEIGALKGGKRVLEESDAVCAICSYHKHGDEIRIKDLLQNYGYQADHSEGYMFFPYDPFLEFRRGVVYGYK